MGVRQAYLLVTSGAVTAACVHLLLFGGVNRERIAFVEPSPYATFGYLLGLRETGCSLCLDALPCARTIGSYPTLRRYCTIWWGQHSKPKGVSERRGCRIRSTPSPGGLSRAVGRRRAGHKAGGCRNKVPRGTVSGVERAWVQLIERWGTGPARFKGNTARALAHTQGQLHSFPSQFPSGVTIQPTQLQRTRKWQYI